MAQGRRRFRVTSLAILALQHTARVVYAAPTSELSTTPNRTFPPGGALTGDVLHGQQDRRGALGLRGRFLHITDLHPDPHYRWKAELEDGCHRKAKGKGKAKDVAGYWGTPVSDCDSPPVLINTTFDWLKRHWSSEVDFVVWTGDSARHDLDPKLPRSLNEILELNRDLADRMRASFDKGTPIIPSIGNNDVYPHNVMAGGPTKLTGELVKIWKHFIPEDEFHVFQRGGYFSKTVIHKHLAVVSLNTMYFYHSNALVDGCLPFDSLSPPSPTQSIDPGTEELDWLEVRLQRYRDEGMQVYLTGHVPPSEGNWYRRCWERYGQLSLQFQDTVIGHLYGHMNEDHFSLIGADEVFSSSSGPGRVRTTASLGDKLLSSFQSLPKRRKLDPADWAIVNVAPSVVPTYNPSARVWIYNVTDPGPKQAGTISSGVDLWSRLRRGAQRPLLGWSDARSSKKGRHSSPHSPVRSNRFLTPLAYTQFYIDLARANKHSGYGPGLAGKERKSKGGKNGTRPELKWEIEYTTATRERLLDAVGGEGEVPLLFPKALAPRELRNVTRDGATRILRDLDADGDNDDDDEDGGLELMKKKPGDKAAKLVKKLTPWQMETLTLEPWIDLARELGEGKKAWKRFRKYMAVST